MFATSQSLVQTPPNLNPPGGGGGAMGDGGTPRNPFSISVILSDEVGQKRSPPSNSVTPQSFPSSSATPLSRNERPRRPSQENTAERSRNHSIGQLFHTPSRSIHQGSGGGTWGQRTVRPSRMTLAEAANLTTKTPPTSTGLLNVPGILSKGSSGSQQPRLTPSHSHSHNSSITASPFNANILQALGQQQMTTPTNKSVDILDDSLGMLSTVALLDSEMSDVNTSAGTSVQERLAGMKITSHHDASYSSHDEDIPRAPYQESSTMVAVGPSPSRKSHTPHILKRDRRRHRKQSLTDFSKVSGSSGSTVEDHTHLNTGFLSPLAPDHAHSKQQFTFSPSIFLSRPGDDSSNPSPQRMRPTSLHPHQGGGNGSTPIVSVANYPVGMLSPSSDSDVGLGEEFVTSTPIKRDKENMHGARGADGGGGGAWSPSILQTSGGTRRHFLRETNDASSGSDSELPVKKLKTTPLAHSHQHKRRKSKARTKLSPLLENACSPIAKADHTHQPSPLVTSVTSTTPSLTLSSLPSHTQAPSTSNATIGQLRPPMTAESAQPQGPPIAPPTPSYSTSSIPQLTANLVLSQEQQHQANTLQHQQSMATVYPMLQKTTAVPNQTTLLSPQATLLNPALSYPFNPIVPAFGTFVPMQSYTTSPVCLPGFLPGISSFYNPQACTTQPVYPTNLSGNVNLIGNTSLVAPKYGKWGGSMCSSPQACSSHLQSVPPWFIFSDKRADSKRSRMTEAINKSLSETPSQKTKLPAEWSKYACGQTDDQRALTEEARSFLLLRPRQLHFDEES